MLNDRTKLLTLFGHLYIVEYQEVEKRCFEGVF